jgi:hypothetical protein
MLLPRYEATIPGREAFEAARRDEIGIEFSGFILDAAG